MFRKKQESTDLEKEIARLYSEMECMNPDDKEYQTRLEVVIKLTALRGLSERVLCLLELR